MKNLIEKIKSFYQKYLSDGFFLQLALFLSLAIVGVVFMESTLRESERLQKENNILNSSIDAQKDQLRIQQGMINYLIERNKK